MSVAVKRKTPKSRSTMKKDREVHDIPDKDAPTASYLNEVGRFRNGRALAGRALVNRAATPRLRFRL